MPQIQPSPHQVGCPRYAAPAVVRARRVSSTLHNTKYSLLKTATARPRGIARAAAAPSIVCRATTATTATSASANSKLKRSVWTAIDVFALLGSVGGALAALLGVVSPTFALTLPLILPVVSLIAALQREDMTNEDSRQYLSELSSSLGRDSAALLREAAAAVEEVRREARGQSATAAHLAALEDKLAVLEGAVVGAARNSREAAVGVSALGSALQQTLQQQSAAFAGQAAPLPPQTAQMLAAFIASEVVPMVKAELAGTLGPWLAESNAALKRLDTRLAVVEGSLAGLEQAQSEGLMRLSNTLNSSLTDSQATLHSSVRVELATAVEPLKQLPQLVSAAAAKAAAQKQQQMQAGGLEQQQLPPSGAAVAGIDTSLLMSDLRELVAAEVSAVTQQLLVQQGDILNTLGQPPRPTPLADDQWEALGRRLARLERLVQSVPELGEQAVAGQLAPLLAAQQAAAESQGSVITTVTSGLGSLSDQLSAGLTHLEGAVQAAAGSGMDTSRLDSLLQQMEAANQQLGQMYNQVMGSGTAAAAPSNIDGIGQLLQQLTRTMQEQQAQAQFQGSAAPGSDLGQITDLLFSLQQQVQGLGAALQQVQMDIPVQVGLAVSQAAGPAAAAGEAGYSGADAAAAAAGVASAAAEGITEVRQMLTGVQQSCQDLLMQVGALSAEVTAQQALLNNRAEDQTANSGAAVDTAQQQLASIAADISSDLSQQLRGLCSSLELQLQGVQQQLVSAAAAATSQALVDAAAVAVSQQLAAPQPQQQEGVAGMGWSTQSAADEELMAGSPLNGSAPINNSSSYVDQQLQDQFQQQTEQQQYREQATAGGWPPHQQQQQQVAQQSMQANGSPAEADMLRAAAASPEWSSYGSPDPAAWPSGPPQMQQQQPGQQVIQPATSADQQQQQLSTVLQLPNPAALTDEQLRTEGLRLLRAGREATRGTGAYSSTGPDFAAAEAQLQAAVACFGRAAESEPQDTRALGNLGNALLAQGELKKGLLDELRLNATQDGLAPAALQSLEAADVRLRSEASTLLTRAGEIFRRVLEVDGWSSRALVNWGKAMVARAELALDTAAAAKLYNAAIDKFEAVLEEDPGLLVAKYRCALAMQGLAGLQPTAAGADGQGSRQQLVLLQDAARYFSDVASSGAGGDEGLKAAAAAALLPLQQQLEMAKLARK